ncbi:DUF4352 domain-containing protein [Paenibacillus pinistramenti]|uniref:DUF4352 domain-containing protein n=1 Tax=Paenibacillus pinistramenti TaxID=1768003 RepID=UPI0011099737|nr:DUF4352 domain-containing protein [Paenibacillus pinistramenti]
MNKRKTLAASLAVSMILGQAVVFDAQAASTSTSKTSSVVHTVSNLAAIKLSSTSTAKLSKVNILSQDQQNVLTYTITYVNNGTTSLSLNDYWTKVKTKSGNVYSVAPIAADQDKTKVAPGASVSVTYMTEIPKNLQYYDLSFQMIKWDFSMANYERSLGSFNVPSSYTIATPLNYSEKLTVDNATAKVKINSVTSIASGDYNYVNVALNVANVGNSVFSDPSWKYVIQTVSGSTFTLSPDSSSTDYSIQSQDNKTLNLIAKIPSKVSLKNLKLMVVQTQTSDSTSSDYAVAMLKMNNPAASLIAQNKAKVLTLDSGQISATVQGATSNQANDETSLSIQLLVKNTGTTKVTVPAYTFEVQAGSTYYPVTTSDFTDLTLDPGESLLASLDATVPTVNARKGNMKLLMKVPASSSSSSTSSSEGTSSQVTVASNYPVAAYTIPDATGLQNTLGTEQNVKNNHGTFGITLDSIQSLPWDDSYLLTSKITIKNNGTTSAQLPDFAGVYKIDMATLDADTQLITTSSTKVLAPGAQTDVYVVTKVPGDLDFNQLQIQLLEKLSDDKTSNWIQFTNLGSLNDLKVVESGSSLDINASGKTASLAERKTYVYKGTSSNIVYTEMLMNNLESSQANLSQMVGYFKTEDGQYYKATTTQIDHAAGPKSSNIVTFYAKLPKNVSTSNLQLIVGEGIKDSALTAVGETSTGYVNATAMALTAVTRDIQSSLSNIDMFPYTLSLENFEGYTDSSGLQISFDYDLTRDLNYDMGEYGHKLILEVTDSSGLRFEKEIELEKDLVVGNDESYSYTVSDPIFETVRTGNFQFSIYDEFQGEKTKIATSAQYYSDSQL